MAKNALPLLAVLVGLLNLAQADLQPKSKLLREEGAIYLDDFLDKPLKLKVLKPANSYATLQGDRYLGTLRRGQEVTVLAISDRAYRVHGKAQQGDIAAWVGPAFLKQLKPEFIANLKKAAERKIIVDELIANEEVAMGMTTEEVLASLGKPTKRTSKVTKTGKTDTLEYIIYEKVPQTRYVRDAFGQLRRQTYYVKVETGRTTIEFENDVAISIAESETNQDRDDLRTIPAPVLLF